MADIIDRSQQEQESFIASALREYLRESENSAWHPAGKVFCKDCGEQIKPERLKLVKNAVRCVKCQQKFEKRFKR
jgi:phage/conjugal plasmid C-4 type zinc finger TraR family protein